MEWNGIQLAMNEVAEQISQTGAPDPPKKDSRLIQM